MQRYVKHEHSILSGMDEVKRERMLERINDWPMSKINNFYCLYKSRPLGFIVEDGAITDIVFQEV